MNEYVPLSLSFYVSIKISLGAVFYKLYFIAPAPITNAYERN